MKKSIFIILAIFIVIVNVTIFILSNSMEDQEQSADKSEGLLAYIVEVMGIEGEQARINEVHKTIRKTAHGLEFTILGVLLALFFRRLEKLNRRKYICAPLFIGLCVGVADEFIQSFNDRSSEVMDILIDFGGILVGVTVTMLIFLLVDRKKKSYRIKECSSE